MGKYIATEYVKPSEIKNIRKKLGVTQKEFAEMIGSSKPSVERWEVSDGVISGPLALLIKVLNEHSEIIDELSIPEKKYPLRMWYMYKDKPCTLIDVDDTNEKVSIKNYVSNYIFRAFGTNANPTYADYIYFLKSRCFPETRDKLKLELSRIGVPFYDPYLIVEKTQGRMAEDDFWIRIED